MQLRNRTILITGGSSGIGLELARQLLGQNNTVLICGRSLEKLQKAQ
ncbi:MAG: SDR family NAD(P)-dependent oxidoreductase [Bacteroidota bacterium]